MSVVVVPGYTITYPATGSAPSVLADLQGAINSYAAVASKVAADAAVDAAADATNSLLVVASVSSVAVPDISPSSTTAVIPEIETPTTTEGTTVDVSPSRPSTDNDAGSSSSTSPSGSALTEFDSSSHGIHTNSVLSSTVTGVVLGGGVSGSTTSTNNISTSVTNSTAANSAKNVTQSSSRPVSGGLVTLTITTDASAASDLFNCKNTTLTITSVGSTGSVESSTGGCTNISAPKVIVSVLALMGTLGLML